MYACSYAQLQELLRPTVVQVLIDPFLAAQLSNAVLATQAFQHDADLLFSGWMPACGSANIPDCLCSALRYALVRLSHGCSSAGCSLRCWCYERIMRRAAAPDMGK